MAPSFDTNGRGLDRRHHDSSVGAGGRREQVRRVGDKKMNQLLMRLYRWNWVPYLLLSVVASWLAYDTFVPVVRGNASVVNLEPNAVVVRLSGTKYRECRYVGIQAYSRSARTEFDDTTITRLDKPATNTTRPRGSFNMGLWRIEPTEGATRVTIFTQHACGVDDLRTTKLAEVKL